MSNSVWVKRTKKHSCGYNATMHMLKQKVYELSDLQQMNRQLAIMI